MRPGVAFAVLDQDKGLTSLLVPNVLGQDGPFVVGDDTRILAQQASLGSCSKIP